MRMAMQSVFLAAALALTAGSDWSAYFGDGAERLTWPFIMNPDDRARPCRDTEKDDYFLRTFASEGLIARGVRAQRSTGTVIYAIDGNVWIEDRAQQPVRLLVRLRAREGGELHRAESESGGLEARASELVLFLRHRSLRLPSPLAVPHRSVAQHGVARLRARMSRTRTAFSGARARSAVRSKSVARRSAAGALPC